MGREDGDSEHDDSLRSKDKEVVVEGSGVREGFLKGGNNGVIGC